MFDQHMRAWPSSLQKIGDIKKLFLFEIFIFHILVRTANDVFKFTYLSSGLVSQWCVWPQTIKIITHTCVMIIYRLHIKVQHQHPLSSLNLPVQIDNVVAGRPSADLDDNSTTCRRCKKKRCHLKIRHVLFRSVSKTYLIHRLHGESQIRTCAIYIWKIWTDN